MENNGCQSSAKSGLEPAWPSKHVRLRNRCRGQCLKFIGFPQTLYSGGPFFAPVFFAGILLHRFRPSEKSKKKISRGFQRKIW